MEGGGQEQGKEVDKKIKLWGNMPGRRWRRARKRLTEARTGEECGGKHMAVGEQEQEETPEL